MSTGPAPYAAAPVILRTSRAGACYACCLNCGTETAHVSYKTPEERLEAARQAAHLWNIGKVIHTGMCD